MTPQEAIQVLAEAGWTEARIAREVGVSQPTVHRIKHGQQRRGASFETCAALIRLAHEFAPEEGAPPSRRSEVSPKQGDEASAAAVPIQPVGEAA